MDVNLLSPDHILLHRLNQGEEVAFDYFFHRYYPLMVTFALRFVRDKEIAEEIVQDVFHKVWMRKESFKDVNALKAFLYISTKNAAYNEISKIQNRYKHQEEYAKGNDPIDQPVMQHIIRTEVYASLSAAINELPLQCQKIIKLLFEEEKKPAEIAEELGVTISTVNSQKARGLKLLRYRLKGKDMGLLWIILAFICR